MTAPPSSPSPEEFIARWADSGASERANYQGFLIELCDLLGVERPAPSAADDRKNTYVFEKAVTFQNPDGTTSTGRIDLYRRGHFVCETKQGSEKDRQDAEDALLGNRPSARRGHGQRESKAWDATMLAARGQAERYVRAIPDDNPPFVLVVDVGYSIELYSDFSRLGKIYTPFPDARSHRIYLKDLSSADLRDRLKLIWTDPLALDPSRRSAKVTREIADKLARLAKSLESAHHDPEAVASFLMRCLFTLFAEDVKLIPDHAFTKLLDDVKDHPDSFLPMVHDVWKNMDAGAFSPALRTKLMRFNGGLFADQTVIPLNKTQIGILHEAAKSDWKHVEPAIFGTLLERALNPTERHKLGAHYTPRAYVERLVLPTIIEPLREEWDAAKTAAVTLASAGKTKDAIAEVRKFLRHLCDTVVLDPACGSGNFLYVTLEHMKRLEGEVRDQLQQFGEGQADFESMGLTVDPHQFKGIEINPRAAHIADLVLWIGYLQWHFRVYGNTPPREPVLKAFHNIENRDAVLAYDSKELVTDDTGKPITRWDGRTMKTHPVTGEDVPDDAARVPVYRYVNPRKAEWPKADFVVGNPPFIGAAPMRSSLGEGYVDALRGTYSDLPESIDFVMYWWDHAANLTRDGKVRRFGLITTNGIRQTFSRRILQYHLSAASPISIVSAIPDHPWVDAAEGAAVRIAMTVAAPGASNGTLQKLVSEVETGEDAVSIQLDARDGKIQADLTVGAAVADAVELEASTQLSSRGVSLHGAGFLVTPEEAEALGLGSKKGAEKHIRPYLNGRDFMQKSRGLMVIDLLGLTAEAVRKDYPEIYQRIFERVKPERDANNRAVYRDNWWIFGEPRKDLRPALYGLNRYLATVETSRHRVFQFLDASVLPDNKLVAVALNDAYFAGVLGSRAHRVWALAAGGWLGAGNDPVYVKSRCFDAFPFPAATDAQKSRIRELGEQLDAHRKKQQAAHPGLTITDMYNVLEKLRQLDPRPVSNTPAHQAPTAAEVDAVWAKAPPPSSILKDPPDNLTLSAKEKKIHEQGLVSVLKQIHDDLDAAVFDAYGWPPDLTDEQILEKLVALNAERAAEEKRGLIRWLRPEFQNKAGRANTQGELDLGDEGVSPKKKKTAKAKPAKIAKQPWPSSMADQAKALRSALLTQPTPRSAEELAKLFLRAKVDRITELLDTFVSLGQARKVDGEKFIP